MYGSSSSRAEGGGFQESRRGTPSAARAAAHVHSWDCPHSAAEPARSLERMRGTGEGWEGGASRGRSTHVHVVRGQQGRAEACGGVAWSAPEGREWTMFWGAPEFIELAGWRASGLLI
jgi:hypothetical protein